MSIEEKDFAPATGVEEKETGWQGNPDRESRERAFLQRLSQGTNREMAKPFGTPDWRKIITLVVSAGAAILFFTRSVNLGEVTLNWNVRFNVNLVIVSLLVLTAVVSFGPKIAQTPRLLRSQNTLTSIGLVLLVAAFFLFSVLDLGTFDYTLDRVDLSSAVGLLFTLAMLGLALWGSKLALVALGGFFLWWGFSIQNFGLVTVQDLLTSENGARLLRSLTPPRWEYFSRVIDPMLLTVQTAVAATVIGIVFALPLSILAARNTTPHPAIYNIIRFLVNTTRAIPSLILALLFIPFVGLGPAAGVLGLGIHSISVLTKLYAEAFEAVKPQPLEALNSVGANGLKTFRWGVFPQAFPLVASYSIYSWESNGRDSTVVAFVGGGGIGFLLQANLALLDYANVAVLLIVLILTVSILDRFSDFVRSKII